METVLTFAKDHYGDAAITLVFFVLLIYVKSGINVVSEWNRRPVLRFGHLSRILGPGIEWIWPFIEDAMGDISIRETVWPMKVERVQTHDNIPITLALNVTSKVEEQNVRKIILVSSEPGKGMYQRAVSATSECISGMELDAILHDRASLSDKLVTMLNSRIAHWGQTIIAVEIQDISITDDSIQEAIALKARAVKEGQAEIARAQFQFQVAQELNKAAQAYSDVGRWMKGTEVLLEMCRSAENNTILIPTDMVEGLAKLIPRG